MTTTENRPGSTTVTEVIDWSAAPTPSDEAGWLERARAVRRILERDAAARDRAGATPYDEVALLKEAGLVTLLGPVEHGGGGQEWPTAYRVIREVAAGDGSIGQAARLPPAVVLGRPAGRHARTDRGRGGRRHPQPLVLRRCGQPA